MKRSAPSRQSHVRLIPLFFPLPEYRERGKEAHAIALPRSCILCMLLAGLALTLTGCCTSVTGSGRDSKTPRSSSVARFVSDTADAPRSTDAAAPQTQSADDRAEWEAIAGALGRKGILADNVYRVVVPRDDLEVSVDSMPVPTAAGIESSFRFYRCSCGKMNAIGEFVVADYEANDVMDVLRHHGFIISSMAPLLIYDRPRLLALRFQAEGKPAELAKTLREALSWTGKERMSTSTQPEAQSQ